MLRVGVHVRVCVVCVSGVSVSGVRMPVWVCGWRVYTTALKSIRVYLVLSSWSYFDEF